LHLWQVTSDLTAVLTDLADEAFQADFKYDGVRAQIHLEVDGTVHIFSRHLENVTDRYPDAVAAVRKAVAGTGVKSLIADTEIVAWDRTVHEILPFQMLMSRPRKNVALADVTVQVKIFFFDLMGGCFLRAIHFLAAVVSNPCSSLCHPPLHPITFLKAINF
jgi:DNA ligase-1